MKVFDGLDALPAPFAPATVAIGTFDGVHRGHQALIATAVADARAHDRPALVFTFDRHPQELLAPDRAPAYLTTPAQRNRLIAELGADALVVAAFDRALSQMSPEAFVRDILKRRLGADSIVVGDNFYFGRERAGSAAYLREKADEFGFALHALEPVLVGGQPASSTRVREAIRAGDLAEAETVLGHSYLLAGTIVKGQQLGRTLGYPTANLALTVNQVVPPDGVWAVVATLQDARNVNGACSLGERPTIEGAGRSLETFLFDFAEDLYGQEMELRFVQFLRPEAKFDSLDALVVQMARDVELARARLASR